MAHPQLLGRGYLEERELLVEALRQSCRVAVWPRAEADGSGPRVMSRWASGRVPAPTDPQAATPSSAAGAAVLPGSRPLHEPLLQRGIVAYPAPSAPPGWHSQKAM